MRLVFSAGLQTRSLNLQRRAKVSAVRGRVQQGMSCK